MGREDLIEDPKFIDNDVRTKNQMELVGIVTDWIRAQKDDQAVIRILEDAGVPCAPILTAVEAINHPHLLQRGTAQQISDRVLGDFIIPGMSFRFSDFPPLELQAPFLGEHNEEVLTGLCSLTPDQVHEMAADGALVSEPVRDHTS
jgi:crotonobetainyl-CoA:carnitine CoA-transferase CaiB-like acyl-CoA transferase